MMRNIEIEEDVYQHLLANAETIGENASAILRRLLRLGPDGTPDTADGETGMPASELAEALASARFRSLRNVKERYLAILGELYRHDQEKFKGVLQFRGHRRRYFGGTEEEVASSGNSVAPKSIPGSPYWALTNLPTLYKKRLLGQVMDTLGYSSSDRLEAVRALGPAG